MHIKVFITKYNTRKTILKCKLWTFHHQINIISTCIHGRKNKDNSLNECARIAIIQLCTEHCTSTPYPHRSSRSIFSLSWHGAARARLLTRMMDTIWSGSPWSIKHPWIMMHPTKRILGKRDMGHSRCAIVNKPLWCADVSLCHNNSGKCAHRLKIYSASEYIDHPSFGFQAP